MFVIRRAKIEDVGTLLKLAKMVHFINLPADKDIISQKVNHSRNCFRSCVSGKKASGDSRRGSGITGLGDALTQSELFMFVLEDVETGSCLGSSQIVAKMGGPENPNVSFKLERREFFSRSLQKGETHVVARLHLDESSPSEIGGLILQPSYRGHRLKLGRFLSLIRFHLVGLYPERFSTRIVAEMMAPITADGHNLLWDYLGRRFINLSYEEADRFCQYSREFMISLLPREDLYLSLLPPVARAVVGEVGPETVPARRMLENLGFKYHDTIDPFDGGPHLEARADEITLVAATKRGTYSGTATVKECNTQAMISTFDKDDEFRAIDTPARIDDKGRVRLPRVGAQALGLEEGQALGYTPYPNVKKPARKRGSK
ncbi:MAG: arginine N-succinyltransferase [Phycisphaerales bacterium]|nr:arginine N-succinyltransferase [Phycisphaerales bacterium]